MSYRYISANDLVDKVDFETQNFINEMPCIYADIKPLNQHINIDEIRADERKKAEQDFQNSDYWNDYLAKVIADAKAEEREKINDDLSEVQQILILYDVDTAEKRREIIDLLEQIKTPK